MKNNFFKTKNANFFTSEVLKIVLAVVAIFILILIPAKLFGISSFEKEMNQARGTLEKIVERLNFMENENKTSGGVMLESPKNWYLMEVEFEEVSKLCVCKNIGRNENEQGLLCVEGGVCGVVDFGVEINSFESENYVGDSKYSAKREAIKISMNEMSIEKRGGVFVLSATSVESDLDSLLDDFLDSKLLNGIIFDDKGFSTKSSVRDLVTYLCDKPRIYWKEDFLRQQIDDFFSQSVSQGEIVRLQFGNSFSEGAENYGLDLSIVEFVYPSGQSFQDTIVPSSDKFSKELPTAYERSLLDGGKECVVYLTSTRTG